MFNNHVSIIIPLYNAEKFIYQTLQSCLNQTLKPSEIIVIDDGSTDNSLALVRSVAHQSKLVKVYSQKNTGPSITRNRGVEYATNEWICFVDSDDILHPQRLEIASKFTEDTDAVICDFVRFKNHDETNFPILDYKNIRSYPLEISQKMVLKYGYGLPRMLMRKSVYISSGGLNKELINNEDHELHFRMLTQSVRFKKIDAPLYFYRQHDGESRLSNQLNKVNFIYIALDTMLSQVNQLPQELQQIARTEIANRIASNALLQARSGVKDYKDHLIKARSINTNLNPYQKRYMNIISKLFGLGNLEFLISKLK